MNGAGSGLIGHDAAERAFLDAWSSGRLAHAWLIAGPRGIGKAALAHRIARFVLAGGGGDGGGLFGGAPETLDIDPLHPVARRVESGGHADFRLIERGWSDERKTKRKSEIPVEEVRGVGSFLSLTPAEGAWRVVIVDSACEMSRSAANAILKVLEEPPAKALLLLVAHSAGRILPTIRSRCRRLVMKPLADAQVVALLGRHRPDLPARDAEALAGLAAGSIGQALALADEGGLALYRDMLGLFAALPRLDGLAVHAFADRAAKDEDGFRTTTTLFNGWLAAAARRVGRGDGDRPDDELALQRRLVEAAGLDRWVEVWEKTTHLFDRAESVNLDRKQVVLNAFFALERACRH